MAPRNTFETADTLVFEFWLTFDADGNMSMTRNRPRPHPGERAMRCETRLPKALFKTPELSATITIAEPSNGPIQIDIAAGEAALKQALGVDVVMTVKEADRTKAGGDGTLNPDNVQV